MHITVLTWGTRGDVQPYLALGLELERRGHRVVLALNQNHLPWLARVGLEVRALPLDVQAAFESEEARRWLAAGRTTVFLRWLSSVEHGLREPLAAALVDACQGADLIVTTHLLAHRAAALAEKLDVPAVRVSTFPTAATGEYPTPFLMNGMPRLPGPALRRLSHRLIKTVALRGQRADLQELRRHLGLQPLAGDAEEHLVARGIRTLNAVSPSLLPRPGDWPEDQVITGHCRLSPEARVALGEGGVPADLAAWLDAGPPPVFFGFGSMPVQDPPYTLAMVGEVCRRLGLRALVGAGWSQYGRPEDPDLRVVESCNHDLVFPRCCAVVHHGGAGTTATGLTAGRPTVVASVFADQPLWGDRVARLGAGFTLPFQRLTAPRLAAALGSALTPEVVDTARALGQQMQAEDGLGATAAAVLHTAGELTSAQASA
jgi:sterol 3beta-glucosyltransferase